MKCTTRLALALAAATSGFVASPADAQQAFTVGLQVFRGPHGGDQPEVKNGAKIFGTVDDCLENIEWRFKTDYFQRISVVEAWLGVGTIDCSTPSNRQKPSLATAAPPCKFLGSNNGVAKADIAVDSRDLFTGQGETASDPPENVAEEEDAGVVEDDTDAGQDDADAEVDAASADAGSSDTATASDGNGCYQTRGTPTKTVYILALDQETNVESNIAQTPLTIQKGILKATFTPYTARPTAPTNVRGKSGETKIGVTFDTDSASQALQTQYRAYFDIGTSDDLDCGSGQLAAKNGVTPIPVVSKTLIASKATTGSSATIGDLDTLGVALGQSVAVSAVTIDPAGNESRPSVPVCVARVETSSFIDACNEDAKCKAGLSTCSLGATPARDWLAGLFLTGLALTFALRRRRNA